MSHLAPHKHLIDLSEWHQIGAAGILRSDKRYELINGEIIEMTPIGSNHAGHLKRLIHLFGKLIGERALLSVQDPLQLSDLSEPQPDLVLLKPRADFYTHQHPCANDVLLLVEIADSSLQFDRSDKLRLYAHHGIPEYWLVNLLDRQLEIYRYPEKNQYSEIQLKQAPYRIQPLLLPELSIDVADLIEPARQPLA